MKECFSCTKRFPEEARAEMEVADAMAHKLYRMSEITPSACVELLNKNNARFLKCMDCLYHGGVSDD